MYNVKFVFLILNSFDCPADGTRIDRTFIGFLKNIFNFIEVKNTIEILLYLRIFLQTNIIN